MMRHIKLCIKNNKDYNPMIHTWDLELFIKAYGISPFLMYKMLRNDPLIKLYKEGDVVKFDRKQLQIVKPTSQ